MKDRDLLREAKLYFIPFLLGSNKLSHGLSSRIFSKYGIVSLIFDQKRSPRDLIDISSRFMPLSSATPKLVCEELIATCGHYQNALPILVPASKEFEETVEEMREELERYFVIRSPETLVSSAPLADIG